MRMKLSMERIEGGITAIEGIEASGVCCGLKKDGTDDLALVYFRDPAVSAGVFTSNRFKAAPLLVTERHIKNPVRALVVNSGNANSCTGERGMEDALATAQMAADHLGLRTEEVLVSSTGVIGSYLPMENITNGINKAAASLSPLGGGAAARAIMTTDTFPKESAYLVHIESEENLSFKVAGMAKGAGMICPDMATLLVFLFTDLPLERDFLQETLSEAVNRSLNVISIDCDTSTNDMALLFSCAKPGRSAVITQKDGEVLKEAFRQALLFLCRDIAVQLVRDGEGAGKVISLTVRGASDYTAARKVARAVLNSFLVKTAVFGGDANWGRIICAVGYSGVEFAPQLVDLYLADVKVAEEGRSLPFDELKAAEIMRQTEVPITIDLHMGDEELLAWGCDLSYDYVKINSSYRS